VDHTDEEGEKTSGGIHPFDLGERTRHKRNKQMRKKIVNRLQNGVEKGGHSFKGINPLGGG